MKFSTILSIAALGMLVACTGDDLQGQASQGSNGKITFAATTEDILLDGEQGTRSAQAVMLDPIALSGGEEQLWLLPTVTNTASSLRATRGALLDESSEMPAFGVSAYKHAKTTDITGVCPDYFYNLKASKSGTTYQIAQDYYWPSSEEYLTFNAYYPYNSGNSQDGDNTDVVLSGVNQAGQQTVTYTVNETVANQADFMTAITANQTPDTSAPTVNLAFHHQLAAIRFVVGGQFATKGYIQNITLKNVYKRGVYTLGAEAGSDWAVDDNYKGDVTLTYQDQDKAITSTVGQELNAAADNETFLMIPTSFAANSDAAVWITYWSAGTPNTSSVIKASLAGKSWEAGKTYTYEISSEKLTTLQIKNITFATTPAGAPRTAWKTNDQVGLFVVKTSEGEGKELRYSNVPCTYDETTQKWTIAQVNNKPVIKYPGDSYYFYYPYQPDNELLGRPSDGGSKNASANDFFSSVVSQHVVRGTQEDINDFKMSDLQIAKAVAPENTGGTDLPASNISAEMVRKVGLAIILLGSDDAVRQAVFDNGATTPSSTTAGTVKASATFSGRIPYNNSTAHYAYVKASTDTSFGSATYSDTNKDAWEQSLVFNVAAGSTQTLTAHSDRKNWEYVDAVWNYSYTTANYYSFTTPAAGNYTMECWGAQGSALSGDYHGWNQYATTYRGGKGGYTVGSINLSQGMAFYVYVGNNSLVGETSEGNVNSAISGPHGYSFNGGRYGSCGYGTKCGGGATDIRVVSGDWNDFASLKSRIMVAGGGGSAGDRGDGYGGGNGGYGGGLTGQEGESNSLSHSSTNTNWYGYYGTPGNQIGGDWYYTNKTQSHIQQADPPIWVVELPGLFGIGGLGQDGEGGGGWYGGGGAEHASGAGGSSYISGHSGCRAIKQTATVNTGGESYHESGSVATINNISYTFTGTSTIDGGHSQPAPGGGTQTGNSGNGYARITLSRW